jgi:sulfur carrier protein ThiS
MSRLHDAARTEARTIGVSVIMSAGLRRLKPGSPDGPQRHTLAAGANLGDLLAALGITATTDLTAAVDGELAERDSPLRDGSEVMLLAPMEGGSAGGAAAEGEATIRKAAKGFCSKRQQQRP